MTPVAITVRACDQRTNCSLQVDSNGVATSTSIIKSHKKSLLELPVLTFQVELLFGFLSIRINSSLKVKFPVNSRKY